MGNKPSGIKVLRQPTAELEHYDYMFDLSGLHTSQINTYLIKPLRARKIAFQLDTQKLCVQSMTPPVFEELFRSMKPVLSIERTRTPSNEIIPRIGKDVS